MKFKDLKKGEILSEQQFYKVEKIVGNEVQLKTDGGENVILNKEYVEGLVVSATQHTSEKVVNKTEAAAIFLSQSGTAVTVNFNKQVKEADVVKEIMATYADSAPKVFEAAVKKAVKGAMVGTERTMVGRHYGELNELGHVQFVDMEEDKTPGKDYDTRLRLVDPRGINWFISRGVKYTVK